MIERGSHKSLSFLNAVGRHVSPGEWRDLTDGDPRLASTDDVIYVGAGYWRMIKQYDADEDGVGLHFKGIILVNPDFSREAVAIVERAIALLLHCKHNP